MKYLFIRHSFLWHINVLELFNAKSIHRENKSDIIDRIQGFITLLKSISQKMNVIALIGV